MPRFRIKAATAQGRLIAREIEAATRQDVFGLLEKEGLYPIEVRARGGIGHLFTLPFSRPSGAVKKRGDFLVFNKGLVALLKAGIPVVECLDVLGAQALSPAFKEALGNVMREVRNGETLSGAMERHPEVFPPLYTASISAGERTGDVVPAINGYINYRQRIEVIRKKVVSALTYPVILTVASVAVVTFLMIYVVPSFSKMYISAGAKLPLASRLLIAVSGFLSGYFPFILVFIAGSAVFLRALLRSAGGERLLDGMKMTFPQFGEIYLSYTVAKFARTLSMVLKSGVHLVHALEMSKGVLNNAVLEEKLDYVIRRAKEGQGLTQAIGEAGFMPPITLRMLGVGERSASLAEMLADIADFNDDEVDHKVGIITDMIEPALMIVMGLIIGTIVVLLYLPIFQLGSTI
ncbi:MAG: type II secretion system F family protein [Deltaproteobacteria bacterium]|nr:type II secretion system F family protein [Deltaproteobacteria bacterium]